MANYQSNKPAAADQLNQSQGDIQQNFEAIEDLITVDHEDFAGGAGDEGKHKQVTLPESAGDPGTAADEIAVYSKLSAVTAETGLFWQKEGAGDVVEMTQAVFATPGLTYLPSGMIFQWGSGTMAGGTTTQALVFHTAFPNALYSIQITATNASMGDQRDYVILAVNGTVNGFTATRSATASGTQTNYTYLSIGY